MEFIWDPKRRARAEEMQSTYGPAARVVVRYVWEGGARDLNDFLSGYAARAETCEKKEWEEPGSSVEETRSRMGALARSDIMPYLFCPFMKSRAIELKRSGLVNDDLENIVCYVANGCSPEEFTLDEKRREEFLGHIGL